MAVETKLYNLQPIAVGSMVPSVSLPDLATGRAHLLEDCYSERGLLLILVRHWNCIFCRGQLAELHTLLPLLEQKTRVVVVDDSALVRGLLTEIHDVAGSLLEIDEEDVVWIDVSDRRAPVLKLAPLSVAGQTLHRHQDFMFSVSPRRGGRRPELDDLEVLEVKIELPEVAR